METAINCPWGARNCRMKVRRRLEPKLPRAAYRWNCQTLKGLALWCFGAVQDQKNQNVCSFFLFWCGSNFQRLATARSRQDRVWSSWALDSTSLVSSSPSFDFERTGSANMATDLLPTKAATSLEKMQISSVQQEDLQSLRSKVNDSFRRPAAGFLHILL